MIKRTVIGSFPALLPHYTLDEAIAVCVDLQLPYVDLISDGEQRTDMIAYFDQIHGLSRTKMGTLEITGKIEPMKDVDDFYKIVDLRKAKRYLSSINKEDVELKVALTGPISLGMTCALNGLEHYETLVDEKLYEDISAALVPIAERVLHIGARLQIDEPCLSQRFMLPSHAQEILNPFLSSLSDTDIDEGRVSLHVCESVKGLSGLYDVLLNSNVGILSLAFSGRQESENIDIVNKKSLEDRHKKLGLGIASNIYPEDEGTVYKRLSKTAEIVGPENIEFVHPDCGFRTKPKYDERNLALEDMNKVEQILANMKSASDSFFESLSQRID